MNQLSKEPMTFQEYQIEALKNAVYPGAATGNNLIYPALKLAGEAGELADKIGKHWRNYSRPFASLKDSLDGMGLGSYTTLEIQAVVLELGDVLWYVAAIANELGYNLNEIALLNLAKLQDRKERNVIKGEGDNR